MTHNAPLNAAGATLLPPGFLDSVTADVSNQQLQAHSKRGSPISSASGDRSPPREVGPPTSQPRKKRHVVNQAPQACISCAKAKTRCELEPGAKLCRRCTLNSLECLWRPSLRGKWVRKKSKQPILPTSNQVQTSACASEMLAFSDTAPIPGQPESQHRQLAGSSYRSIARAPSTLTGVYEGSHIPKIPSVTDLLRGSDELPTDQSHSSTPMPHLETPAEEPQDFGGAVHFKVDNSLFPLGLLAESSLIMGSHRTAAGTPPAPTTITSTGPANRAYFQQGLNAQFVPRSKSAVPTILSLGLVNDAVTGELFEIFFTHCNPQIGLLDPSICSPASLASRSPFLFTAICAVASRYYKGGVLYRALMHHAQQAGLEAMLHSKTTYTVQGFILLNYWSPPATAYELDHSWLFAGIAIRLAQEIGLHHKNVMRTSPNTNPSLARHYEAEMLNRERTWFCCFILDRAHGALSGKPETLYEKFLLKSSSSWCHQKGSTMSDVMLAAIVELLRIVFRILDVIYSSTVTKSAIAPNIDYVVVVEDLTQRLETWIKTWDQRLEEKGLGESNPIARVYRSQLKMYMSFYKLIPLSIGLQNAIQRDDVDVILFSYPSYQCAIDVLDTALGLGKEWLRYTTDHWSVIITYCSCFLLKLLNTKSAVSRMFDSGRILEYSDKAAQALEDSAEDEEHSLFVYAAFIRQRVAFERRTAEVKQQQATVGDSAPRLADAPACIPPTTTTPLLDVDTLLQTDWLDTLLSQQTQGHCLDFNFVDRLLGQSGGDNVTLDRPSG